LLGLKALACTHDSLSWLWPPDLSANSCLFWNFI